MKTHEFGLNLETAACLLAASMHSYLILQSVVVEDLSNSDNGIPQILSQLRKVLASNVICELEKGQTDPNHQSNLLQDSLYLRAVADQPVNQDVGAGASLLLSMHEQISRLS